MITTLTGPNSFEIQHRLKQLVKKFVDEHGDLALERLDGEEISFDRIQNSIESLPFLASKKLVVLRSPGANKDFTEKFKQAFDRQADSTDLIIVEPKLDKRLSYYKFLKSKTEFIECNELDARQLANWLSKEAQKRDGQLSPNDAYYLVERVGLNQQMLFNELQKLLEYNPKITRQTIDLLTEETPQSTIFQLIDAAFAGNPKRALKLYDEQRRLKVEPLNIMGMLAWQLHILAVVKTAGQRSVAEIASQAKINPYVVQKNQTIAKKLSYVELKKLITEVTELDEKLKTTAIDPDEALKNLLFNLTNPAK
ncbi:MAG TPA: DNA polymerase III subunit delta [Candidatus Saccharimonadales bacterium]|nr:DNA polymerase III subunit delta [Candidatus Saccharimonadales bacterium]